MSTGAIALFALLAGLSFAWITFALMGNPRRALRDGKGVLAPAGLLIAVGIAGLVSVAAR